MMRRPIREIDTSRVKRFIIKVEGLALEEFEEIELPALPRAGEPIETRYGTCLIVSAEMFDEGNRYAGEIVCRLP
jgi:hypothetical protein